MKTKEVNMVASTAEITFNGSVAEVKFISREDEAHTISFKKRKSWSMKKYVNKGIEAIEGTGIIPSWDFTYSWDTL